MLSFAEQLVDKGVETFTAPPSYVIELNCVENKHVKGILARIGGVLPINPSIKHVLSLGFRRIQQYFLDLFYFNERKISEGISPYRSVEPVYTLNSTNALVYPYHQLPCDLNTRRKRCDLLERRGFREKVVLLLGDDDLVSHELSKRGFSQVLVTDCDRQLLERIQQLTTQHLYPPRLYEADLTKQFRSPVKANVVCLDPPQEFIGTKSFIDCALENLDQTADATIFLMQIPSQLGAEHMRAITDLLKSHGFYLTNHFEKFNSYPLGRLQKIALRLAWLFLVQKKSTLPWTATHYYFSDCFEFVRKGSAKEVQSKS